MRWNGLVCGLLLAGASTPAMAAVTLHGIYAAGDCSPPTTETIDVPRGTLVIRQHIVQWTASNFAGIPHWMGYQRYEPEHNGYTGFAPFLANAAGPEYMRQISSVTTPASPRNGGVLDFEERDEVMRPFRMQVQIAGPTYHSGDGACHQFPMEQWLTIDAQASSGVSAPWVGQWTGNLTLTQDGATLKGHSDMGDVVGAAQGPEFNGYWLATSSRYKCPTERNGTWYWGRIHWTMTADGKHFVGSDSYCDADPASGTSWNGDRIGGAVQPPPPAPPGHHPTGVSGDFSGQWSSNWGAMTLITSGGGIVGTFEHANGKVSGQAQGGEASGFWMQDTAAQRCDSARNGTYYWGRFQWTLAADGQSFSGLWGYCDASPDSGWTGTRTGGGPSGGYSEETPSQSPSHRGPDDGQGASSGWSRGDRQHGYAGDGAGSHSGRRGQAADEVQLFDNWNTAACDFTDTAVLDLDGPAHVSRIAIWFNWHEGERQLSYSITQHGREVGRGTLTRGDCDPYQSAWCEARDAPDADLPAGRYQFQVERDGVCQNGGSDGAGFIKAWGYRTGD